MVTMVPLKGCVRVNEITFTFVGWGLPVLASLFVILRNPYSQVLVNYENKDGEKNTNI